MKNKQLFFSFNKAYDWNKGISSNLVFEDYLSIKKTNEHVITHNIILEDLPGLPDLIDIAVDKANGRLILLDINGFLWSYNYNNDHLEQLTKNKYVPFSLQSVIAITNHIIFIADPIAKTLFAFSMSNWQLLWELNEFNGKQLVPVALTTDTRQNLYMVGIKDDLSFVVLKLNLFGDTIEIFKDNSFVLEYEPSKTVLPLLFSIGITKDGHVSLLNRHKKEMYIFEDGHLSIRYPFKSLQNVSNFVIDSNDFVYIGDHHVSFHDESKDTFVQAYKDNGTFQFQIPSYRGRIDKLFIDGNDGIYVWNRITNKITILRKRPRIKKNRDSNIRNGFYISHALDSKSENTRWHKVTIDGEIPQDTQLKISFFSSNQKEISIDNKFIDIDSYIKDDMITFENKMKTFSKICNQTIVNGKDALLFKQQGRYLWFMIEIIGSEVHSPIIRKTRIYFPRETYLNYLPTIYQEDKESKDFLERFLSLFESYLAGLDQKIEDLSKLFDYQLASDDFLQWLSSWIGLQQPDAWSIEQIKRFLKEAPEIYRRRGTKFSLSKMIEIYIGKPPIIIEYFQLSKFLKETEIKRIYTNLYGQNHSSFFVMLEPDIAISPKTKTVLEAIIEQEKPIFTEGSLVVLERWIYLDVHSYLGLNTYLSELSPLILNNKSVLPTESVIVDVENEKGIGNHMRLEIDSKLGDY